MGYENVAVYPHGYDEWEEQGYKTWTIEDVAVAAEAEAEERREPAQEPAETEVVEGEMMGTIDEDFFREVVEERPESVQLIDVRNREEFQEGHFPTAERMTVDDIEERIEEFDTSQKPIVLYCATGARSGEAYFLFEDHRPELDVYYLDADVNFNGADYSIE